MHYDPLDIDSLLLSDKEGILIRRLLISPQYYYDLGHIVDHIQHDFIGICAMYPYLFMSMHQSAIRPALVPPPVTPSLSSSYSSPRIYRAPGTSAGPDDPLASYHKINHVLFAKLSDKYSKYLALLSRPNVHDIFTAPTIAALHKYLTQFYNTCRSFLKAGQTLFNNNIHQETGVILCPLYYRTVLTYNSRAKERAIMLVAKDVSKCSDNACTQGVLR